MIRRRRAVVVAGPLLLALVPTCAGHLPPCPAAGGPAWAELTDLEQLQAALLTVFGVPPDLDTGRLPVVVVDRGWTDFSPRQVEGFFTQALFQPLVVMVAGG